MWHKKRLVLMFKVDVTFFRQVQSLLCALLFLIPTWSVANEFSDISSGLVGYWSFDDGNAKDSSGNGNDGTANANLTYVAGHSGKAARFGGYQAKSQIVIPNSASLKFTTGATFSAWIKLESVAGINGNGAVTDGSNAATLPVHTIFGKRTDRSGFTLDLVASKADGYSILGGPRTFQDVASGCTSAATFTSNKWLPLGQWAHVTWVMSSSQGMQTYVNGALYWSTPCNVNFSKTSVNSERLVFGYHDAPGYDYPFAGLMDEVRIYNRAISTSEIHQLYSGNVIVPTTQPILPRVYINTNATRYGPNDVLTLWLNASNENLSTDLYGLKIALLGPNQLTYFDNGSTMVQEDTFFVKNISVPDMNDWYERLNYVFDRSLPRGNYSFAVGLFDKDGKVISRDVAKFYFSPDIARFAGVSESPLNNYIEPSRKNEFAFYSSSDRKAALEKLGTGLKDAYRFYKKEKDIRDRVEKTNDLIDEVNGVISDYDSWKNDTSLSGHADDLLAITLMLKMLERNSLYAINTKGLMDGIQTYYRALYTQSIAYAEMSNSVTNAKIVFDHPFFDWNSRALVDVYLTPMEVCDVVDGNINVSFKDCSKIRTDSGNISTSKQKIGQAYSKKDSFGGTDYFLRYSGPRGLFLLEAREVDNPSNVHRSSLFLTGDGQEVEVTIYR